MSSLAYFFKSLLSLLFPYSGTAALVEEATFETLGPLLSPRQLSANTVGLLPYKHKLVRALIVEAKFYDNAKAVSLLASVLTEYLEGVMEDESAFGSAKTVLLPVPLGRLRKKERGYNQVERIASATGLALSTSMLTRTRETKPQTSLQRDARVENVKGAFSVVGEPEPSIHYIVVDDVTTTGATLHEAAAALTRAGGSGVSAIALAY